MLLRDIMRVSRPKLRQNDGSLGKILLLRREMIGAGTSWIDGDEGLMLNLRAWRIAADGKACRHGEGLALNTSRRRRLSRAYLET